MSHSGAVGSELLSLHWRRRRSSSGTCSDHTTPWAPGAYTVAARAPISKAGAAFFPVRVGAGAFPPACRPAELFLASLQFVEARTCAASVA